MIVSDLDRVQHPASIEANQIVIRQHSFDAETFVFSGIVLVSYDESEEAELKRLGLINRP